MINTRDIDAAVAALRSGRCTRLNSENAGWGDAAIARLAAVTGVQKLILAFCDPHISSKLVRGRSTSQQQIDWLAYTHSELHSLLLK